MPSRQDPVKQFIAKMASDPFRNGQQIGPYTLGYDFHEVSKTEFLIRIQVEPGRMKRDFRIKVSEMM